MDYMNSNYATRIEEVSNDLQVTVEKILAGMSVEEQAQRMISMLATIRTVGKNMMLLMEAVQILTEQVKYLTDTIEKTNQKRQLTEQEKAKMDRLTQNIWANLNFCVEQSEPSSCK